MSNLWKTTTHPIVEWANESQNWRTKKIQPINQRLLEIEIASAIRADEPEKIAGIGDAHPLEITSDSDAVWLSFLDYVSYSVTDETLALHSKQENGSGIRLRILQKSFFLEFVMNTTWACPEYPGELVHYQINTIDHTINVVTSNPPEIAKMKVADIKVSS